MVISVFAWARHNVDIVKIVRPGCNRRSPKIPFLDRPAPGKALVRNIS
jgi:hypothetical protein